MVKIFVASFNRATNGALSKLVQKMKDNNLWTDDYTKSDYILAVADREETFDFVLQRYRENYKIIHLWAGEITQGNHDEVYRHSMTLMSDIQLCTNERAAMRVVELCRSVDKPPFGVHIIGNIMLDNLDTDDSCTPQYHYNLILYNPPTLNTEKEVIKEINDIIRNLESKPYIWLPPNGDKFSEIVNSHVNTPNLERSKFLSLIKHCDRFITNSSCEYYEAPFLMDKKNIIHIGIRNVERESKYSKMDIPNASDNVISIFKGL